MSMGDNIEIRAIPRVKYQQNVRLAECHTERLDLLEARYGVKKRVDTMGRLIARAPYVLGKVWAEDGLWMCQLMSGEHCVGVIFGASKTEATARAQLLLDHMWSAETNPYYDQP